MMGSDVTGRSSLCPLPGDTVETTDFEGGERQEGRGREVEVPDGAARAAVDGLNGDSLALVWKDGMRSTAVAWVRM